jgi:high-affinity iron transporter
MILYVYLVSLLPNSSKVIKRGFGYGLVFAITLFLTSEMISEMWEGQGTELLKSALAILGFISFILVGFIGRAVHQIEYVNRLIVLGCVCVVSLYLSGFMQFMNSNLQSPDSVVGLALGVVIGIGTGLSFSVLYHFVLTMAQKHKLNQGVVFVWSMFLAGQLSQSYYHLAQIDVISLASQRLSFGHWISERSEYGHMLAATLGLELSPSLHQFYLYLLATTAVYFAWRRGHSSEMKGDEK